MRSSPCPCPTCGHVPAAKRSKPAADPIAVFDVDVLTIAELRAYRTKTAPYCDIGFFIDNGRGLSPALLDDARALETHVDAAGRLAGVSRADFYRRYFALSDRRRVERNAIGWIAMQYARKAEAWTAARAADTAIWNRLALECARKAASWATSGASIGARVSIRYEAHLRSIGRGRTYSRYGAAA